MFLVKIPIPVAIIAAKIFGLSSIKIDPELSKKIAGNIMAGKIAVGLVVLNRMNDNRYPNTICDVVYQG